MKMNKQWLQSLIAAGLISLLIGCNSSSTPEEPVVVEDKCETTDEDSENENCGKLLLGLTDADGDFLAYQVEVTALDLTRRDGTQVSTLPVAQTLDFTDYVEMTELMTSATVPNGIYTSGSITINYVGADIQVEKDGLAESAVMVDADGNALSSATLQIQLDGDRPLVIAHGRPALLEVDFNLAASHQVDLEASPIAVTTEPFLIAEVDPVMNKEFRIRGPLIRTNEDESFFRIAVRPGHRHDGRHGGANVFIDDETNFEINGETFVGNEGLAQMATLEQGSATVSFGVFSREEGQFTAQVVMAGSSVPGFDSDFAKGVIRAREGNQLSVHGVALIRENGQRQYVENLSVTLGDNTRVVKSRRADQAVTIADLSVGQAVTVMGNATETDDGWVLDASEGGVKMRLTYASGHSLASDSGLVLDLQALQARRPALYDFSGTGIAPEFDANPAEYQVATSSLNLGSIEAGDPVRVAGYVRAFGQAPEDFDAVTVADYSQGRSQLWLNWPDDTDGVAFSEITESSMVINLQADGVYKLIQGGIRTDLSSFEQAVTIVPFGDRGIYTLRMGDSVFAFSNFADFSLELQQKLEEGMSIDLAHGLGGFATDAVEFKAVKLAIKLVD